MAVSYSGGSTHWSWDQATLTPSVNGNTAPGSMLVATLYWDATKTVTAVPASFTLVSTVQSSGDLRAAIYVMVVTEADGANGDMIGVQLDWTQSSAGTMFGVSIVNLIAGSANPARVLAVTASPNTTGVPGTTWPAPAISFDEAACVVTSFASSDSTQPTGPGSTQGRDAGVGTVVQAGQTATTDYEPGDWTSGSSAEQVTFSLAVVDTTESEPVDPDPVTLPTGTFEVRAYPFTVTGEPPDAGGEETIATAAFKATAGVWNPRHSTATRILIDVVNVANEDEGAMTVAAQLEGGDDTWIEGGDTAILTDPKVWKFTTDGTHEIQLIPNSTIEAIGKKPGSTWYVVSLGKGRKMKIAVPAANGAVSLYDCRQAFLDRT